MQEEKKKTKQLKVETKLKQLGKKNKISGKNLLLQQKTKKLDFDLQSLKRKAVDNGEDGPPQKYKIYKSKNDQQKTASNVPLQARLNDIVSKVTMPDNNQQGPSNDEDSIWIPLMDDDEDRLQAIAPSQGIAVPEPTTATQQVSSSSVNKSQLSIAERQLAELTAGNKRRKGLKTMYLQKSHQNDMKICKPIPM